MNFCSKLKFSLLEFVSSTTMALNLFYSYLHLSSSCLLLVFDFSSVSLNLCVSAIMDFLWESASDSSTNLVCSCFLISPIVPSIYFTYRCLRAYSDSTCVFLDTITDTYLLPFDKVTSIFLTSSLSFFTSSASFNLEASSSFIDFYYFCLN